MKPLTFRLALMALSLTALPAHAGETTRISVTGEAEVEAVPDYVELRVGVLTQDPQAKAAMAANASRMAQVRKALAAAGVAPRDIQTSQMQLQPQYRYAENQPPAITGYQVNSQLRLISRDVQKTGALLDVLVAQGVNQIDGPHFGISTLETLRDKARVAAFAQAQARVALYARAAGLHVKRIIDISESSQDAPQPPQPMLRVLASEAAPSTQLASGSMAVRASVSLQAELEDISAK